MASTDQSDSALGDQATEQQGCGSSVLQSSLQAAKGAAQAMTEGTAAAAAATRSAGYSAAVKASAAAIAAAVEHGAAPAVAEAVRAVLAMGQEGFARWGWRGELCSTGSVAATHTAPARCRQRLPHQRLPAALAPACLLA